LERNGKPAVIIASAGFEKNLQAAADAFNYPDVKYVVVPRVYNNLSTGEAREQTEPVVDQVVAALLGKSPNGDGAGVVAAPAESSANRSLDFSGDGELDALQRFNREFLDRDWGDGFPLWPPLPAKVAELCEGVDGDPDDLVCELPPGNGLATVRLVAANAAMAGCRPQEMPVIMAILRAIAKNDPIAMSIVLLSTSAHAGFVVVNGPIGTELGINGGRACIGPGRQNEVNLRIGRAVVLCLKNIGRWYPGVLDLDTLGTTRKFLAVIAENEAENPWEPYHVSQGYAPEDNTVTAFWTSGEWDISIQGHQDAAQLARAIGSYSGGANGLGWLGTLHGVSEPDEEGKTTLPVRFGRLLLLTPPHARPLAEGGFGKKDLERLFWELGQEPIERLIEPFHKMHEGGKTRPEYDWLWDLSKEEQRTRTMPVIETPEDYTIVVAGSVRAKDLLFTTRCQQFTERITAKPDGSG
jgi:hypothetical protein